MENRLLTLKDSGEYKIIVISDVHGYFEYLTSLLKKIKINEEDYLIILGDFINKGDQNIETLKLIRKLNDRKRTYIVSGNHEYIFQKYLMNDDMSDVLLDALKKSKRNGLLKEWLIKYKVDIHSIRSGKELKEILLDYVKDDILFLCNLPYGLELNGHIFVHSGIDEVKDWRDSSVNSILRTDAYYQKKNISGKTVVVGHWPTQNIRPLSINNDIIHLKDKNIICIDGGTIKGNKQLNALVITKIKEKYYYKQVDEDKHLTFEVIKDCIPFDERLVKIDWKLNKVKVIEEDQIFSLVKNLDTKKVGYIFNDFIIKDNDSCLFNPYKIDYVSRFLRIKKGSIVKYVLSHQDYALVKSKTEFGWIKKECLKGIL